ncbi:pectinesterase inhibitor 12-like [Actinidia eriantha]|uniref:pectinesterase inhibitor 12-like n=1 Tax=Actinidia eriantha TaxID=165200 RepID=UPI00258F9863|nr:pectinesterase inhibitor 12-like [Actinidia eriantha]
MSIRLVKNKVTDSHHYIIKYMFKAWNNNSSVPYCKTCFRECFMLYSDAIDDLEKAVKVYKSEKYQEVRAQVSAALTSLTTCESGFKKTGLVSPLTTRFNNAVQLSEIALNILSMLS